MSVKLWHVGCVSVLCNTVIFFFFFSICSDMCLRRSDIKKGVSVGDSSFYSSFDFPGFMYIEMLKCF